MAYLLGICRTHLADRVARAERIIAHVENYKICEGCDSIVASRVTDCPNCHGYRFNEDPTEVISQRHAGCWLPEHRPSRDVLQI